MQTLIGFDWSPTRKGLGRQTLLGGIGVGILHGFIILVSQSSLPVLPCLILAVSTLTPPEFPSSHPMSLPGWLPKLRRLHLNMRRMVKLN